MNPAIVGRDALTIARIAGIDVPQGTPLLVSDEKGVGPKYPFSKEKLTALLGFYVVEDWHAGVLSGAERRAGTGPLHPA